MAFGTSSKIFSSFLTDALNGTAAFDLNSDTIKAALYGNTGTPDQTDTAAHNAYNGSGGAWVTANELSNGGWAAGGIALSSVTSGFASNVYTFDAADTVNSSTATITAAYGVLVYDDTLTTPVADQGISYNYLGGPQSVSAGYLTVQWGASGIVYFTL